MFTSSNSRWTTLLYFSIALIFAGQTLAIPTPLGFEFTTKPAPPHNSDYEKSVLNAFIGANKQIDLMKSVVAKAHSDATAKKTLVEIFNDKYNLAEITKIVEKLEITHIHIIDWEADLPAGVVARAIPGTNNIIIGKTFYKGHIAEQIATIIHESTHLFGTVDWWDYLDDAKTILSPIAKNSAGAGSINGYMEQNFWDVYYHAGSLTYRNADTWALFGFYLEHHAMPPPPHLKVKPPPPVIKSNSRSPSPIHKK